jgi:hypothetical protein
MKYNYPAYKRLMFHPKNEGTGNHEQGKRAKAEGVVAGVADLLLQVPSNYPNVVGPEKSFFQTFNHYIALAIEMKTKSGRQSDAQKEWQRFFEAAGGKYVIVRDYEEFKAVIKEYIRNVPPDIHRAVCITYSTILKEEYDREKKKIKKIFGNGN